MRRYIAAALAALLIGWTSYVWGNHTPFEYEFGWEVASNSVYAIVEPDYALPGTDSYEWRKLVRNVLCVPLAELASAGVVMKPPVHYTIYQWVSVGGGGYEPKLVESGALASCQDLKEA